MQIYKKRDDVPKKYKWILTDFFLNENAFNKSLKKTRKLVDELSNYVGCTKDAKRLYEFVNKQVEAICLWENLYVYASLINDQELGISENVERLNKTNILNKDLVKNTSFFSPELLKLSSEEYAKLFVDEPKLLEVKDDLDKIYRNKDYILEENEEKNITELVNSVDHFAEMSSTLLNNQHDYGEIVLDDGTVEKITPTNYRKIMKKSSRETRKKIYNSFNRVLKQYAATEAGFLNSYVGMKNAIAKIYHFNNAWEQKIFGLNMPNKVYETLVSAAEDKLEPYQRYFVLKRRVLGLKELEGYDMPMELASSKKEYTIEEAQELVRKAIEPLGAEYLTCFDKIIENQYVDYCQYPGKCSGGYSFGTLDHDSRILMSFNYDLDSVSTLAHESGHNVHYQMVAKYNPIIYRDVSSLVAEVVSLTNECLLSSYLAENAETEEEKNAGIANFINVFVLNFYGAIREGKMEQDMHNYVLEGHSLTKDYLFDLNTKSLEKYYGGTVKLNEYSGNGWILRSHYYMAFYLYSYAICISVASYVASKILNKDSEMLKNYLKFMKTGGNVWSIDAFKILGVDLEDKNVYNTAIEYYMQMLDKLDNNIDNKGV